MRYLFDTNVLVAALRSRQGASHVLLRRALQGEMALVVHHKLVYEYRDVLSRPDFLAQTGLSVENVEVVLAHLVATARAIDVRYLWRPNLKDEGEGDNFIVEIAVAAWPCTIVTHNLQDFARAELRFPQIAVCSPGQLLRSLTH